MKILSYVLALLFSTAFFLGAIPQPSEAGENVVKMKGTEPAYQVNKHDAKNRFCYDGSCILKGSGEITINLSPDKQTGTIEATFDGPDGKWRIVQNKFKLIATDVNLHGATGGDVDPELSPPVLPQVWTYVATWGPATVYHDGKLAWKGPTHLMVTEEVRDPVTGMVDYKGPMMAKEYPGTVHNKRGIQVHYVTHPDETPTKGYLPPFTKFVHLMWEKVVWE